MSDAPTPTLATSLWPHQLDAYRRAYLRSGYLLAYDMGCGKTLTAIALLEAWQAKRVLILCPKSVVAVWPREFAKHGAGQRILAPLEGGSVTKRQAQAAQIYESGQPFALIINYEAAARAPFARWAATHTWDAVILDEAHRVKAAAGATSRFCAKLRNVSKRRLCLTGTPMPHSPLDIYAQYRFLDPSVFGLSFTTFKQRYAVWGGYEGRQPIAWINQEELNAKVYSIASRVTKRDVLTLPPVTHVERYCELGAKAKAEYKSLERDFWAWVESAGQEVTVTNALVKLLRLQQMTSGFVLGDDGEIHETDSAKASAFSDWLEDLALDEPLVVFCRFTHDLEVIEGMCSHAGRTVGILSGRRNDLLAWQRGELDVLVVQIQAGAEGIDLTRAAYACYYSLGFSLGQYEQSLARLDRPGQTRPVTYTHFLAQGTVDTQVYAALRKRKEVVEAILRRDESSIDRD